MFKPNFNLLYRSECSRNHEGKIHFWFADDSGNFWDYYCFMTVKNQSRGLPAVLFAEEMCWLWKLVHAARTYLAQGLSYAIPGRFPTERLCNQPLPDHCARNQQTNHIIWISMLLLYGQSSILENNPQIAKDKRNRNIKCFDYNGISVFGGVGRDVYWIKTKTCKTYD